MEEPSGAAIESVGSRRYRSGAIRYSEFAIDVLEVFVDRSGGDTQALGGGECRNALDQQVQQLGLTPSEAERDEIRGTANERSLVNDDDVRPTRHAGNESSDRFATVQKRPARGSYTGYGKRLPSDKAPVTTPRELALLASGDGTATAGTGGAPSNGSNGAGSSGSNGAAPAGEPASGTGGFPPPVA